ncbi:hypothetical protein EN829_006680 [Mesorhizobium sp. M00.F.Ca.ET.186.01.1.1]|nr:hypothetical protein EN848_01985 [bacterium M00.F.Ca.ET.205.01.1.1]TGU54620.1 hypothetical protein EN795_06400 [bacterium M00.F.Ca.ET.152.01.1.1]TGV38602.1 hypothetical protein EN829_006680 [Mesorhizobium sp. M00.F.Ca.ET.186.01.1.1]TGZ44192.1 hypothetical protein EN805_06405 [bacterium M00.F.Ca.ET.162.01.1.1]
MDRLTIQDAFEPYYAGRKSFPLAKDFSLAGDKRLPAKSGPASKPAAPALPTDARLSDSKPDSTTEH